MSKIYWIEAEPSSLSNAQLAIVARPRGNDWLMEELQSLHRQGINVIVSFLEAHERRELGLDTQAEFVQGIGMEYLNFAIRDRQVPDSLMETQTFIRQLVQLLDDGKSIALHCRQSVGRAGFMAAAILVEGGMDVDSAFSAVEIARGCPVPDTEEQRQWVARYAELRDVTFAF